MPQKAMTPPRAAREVVARMAAAAMRQSHSRKKTIPKSRYIYFHQSRIVSSIDSSQVLVGDPTTNSRTLQGCDSPLKKNVMSSPSMMIDVRVPRVCSSVGLYPVEHAGLG